MRKLPLTFIQNCDNFRFLDYALTLSHFEDSETIDLNIWEGYDNLEVCSLGGKGNFKTYKSVQGGGRAKNI